MTTHGQLNIDAQRQKSAAALAVGWIFRVRQKLTERQTVATYAENGKLFSEYGNFCEGDFVSRNGTDVHLVTNMSEDGYAADFVCVIEPSDGWAKIGEVESNLCSRYSKVNYTPPN